MLIATNVLLLSIYSGLAQSPPSIPPGVPEPGLIIWGIVVNATNTSQPIQITSASWSVTGGSKTAVYSQMSRPPVQVVSLAGQSSYVLEVPFDTRRFGNVVLNDPAVEGVTSFELTNAPAPTYVLMATINGALASVRAIDGAPATGTNVPVSGFSSAVRGRVIRVDLAITPIVETYDQWAVRIFGNGSPDGLPGADPDHDGFTNASEYAAGTDPRDPASVLRLLSITVGQNQTTVGWQSVANKQYVMETATDATGPWTGVSSNQASGLTAQATVNHSLSEVRQFYRVRVLPP
jgi:hypothetical protein